jgi:hypothetical protein
MPNRLRGGRCYARAVAFEKATQNNRLVRANIVRDKSQFIYILFVSPIAFH